MVTLKMYDPVPLSEDEIVCGFVSLFTIGSLILFFTLSFPHLIYRDPYYHTTCTVTKIDITSTYWCDIGNCSCTQAPPSLPPCNTVQYNTQCRNGQACCSSGCDTCTGMKKYPCGDTTCEMPYTYQCNCGCRSSVTENECSVVCQTSNNVTFTYSYDNNSNVTSLEKCSKGDQTCVDSLVNNRPINTSLECWINDNTVYFSHSFNRFKYFAMCVTFLSVSFICCVAFWSPLCCCRKKKRETK